jgi:hypothetical protein
MSENVGKCKKMLEYDVGGGWRMSKDVLENFGCCQRVSEDVLVDFRGCWITSDNVRKCWKM